MRKCTNIFTIYEEVVSHILYDILPDPFEFPNIWGKFYFLFYQCKIGGTLGIPQCPSDNNRASKLSELQLAGCELSDGVGPDGRAPPAWGSHSVSAERCGRELSDGVGPGGRLLQHEEVAGTAQCLPKGAARELSDGVSPDSRLLQHEEVAGTAQCLPQGAAVICLMVSAQAAGYSSMRKWPALLSIRRKVQQVSYNYPHTCRGLIGKNTGCRTF